MDERSLNEKRGRESRRERESTQLRHLSKVTVVLLTRQTQTKTCEAYRRTLTFFEVLILPLVFVGDGPIGHIDSSSWSNTSHKHIHDEDLDLCSISIGHWRH